MAWHQVGFPRKGFVTGGRIAKRRESALRFSFLLGLLLVYLLFLVFVVIAAIRDAVTTAATAAAAITAVPAAAICRTTAGILQKFAILERKAVRWKQPEHADLRKQTSAASFHTNYSSVFRRQAKHQRIAARRISGLPGKPGGLRSQQRRRRRLFVPGRLELFDRRGPRFHPVFLQPLLFRHPGRRKQKQQNLRNAIQAHQTGRQSHDL